VKIKFISHIKTTLLAHEKMSSSGVEPDVSFYKNDPQNRRGHLTDLSIKKHKFH
jgi:hypothetical protein